MGNFFENFSYGAIAATAAPIIIFAGIYAAWDYARSTRADLKEKSVHSRSISIGVLHGGKLALQRMISYHQARADPTILSDTVQNELNLLLKDQHPDLPKLRSVVAKLEMSGQEVEAVRRLEEAFGDAGKNQKPHEAYEIDMLLVEMLIYKGDFGKASQCECLKHEQISDARRPLYKAILHVLLENQEKQASECWNDFVAIREHFLWHPSMQEDKLDDVVVSDFKEFMKLVELLKKDIRVAVKAKEKQK